MITSSGTLLAAGTAAGSSGCKSQVTALNTMLMLLGRPGVPRAHSWFARSHKGDSDGCSPNIVLIVFHHCIELLSPILLTLDW